MYHPFLIGIKQTLKKGWGGANSVSEFLGLYTDALGLGETGVVVIVNGKPASQHLREGSLGISYTDYDWDLNDVRQ